MMRYPWTRTEAALNEMAAYTDGVVAELDYVSPETGTDVLSAMGFTAMRIGAGQVDNPPLRSSSSAFHVIKGRGTARIDDKTIEFGPKDTFTAPVFAGIHIAAADDTYLVRIHDRPLQDKRDTTRNARNEPISV